MTRRAKLLLLGLAATLGCAESRITSNQDEITASVQSSGIEITNSGAKLAYYKVLDSQMAAAALWVPCADRVTCVSVAPGATAQVAASEIAGWGNSDTVIVYWWHLVRAEDGTYRADEIRSYHVRI